MEDLFRELIQGSGRPGAGDKSATDPLSGILQGLLGGGSGQQATGAETASDPLSGMLQGLLGGGSAESAELPSAPSGAGGLDLGGLLQGLLGGGGMLGGGASESTGASAGGLGGILGAIMGGGTSSTQADPFTSAIANMLSNKLGLPPQIAHAVVAFVLGKLLHGRVQAGSGSQATSGASAQSAPQGLSLDGLLGRMNSGATVRKSDIRATGMAKELAAYTGLDRKTAEASLQQVLNALGGEVGSTVPARTPRRPKESGLDGLLEDWHK
jgi:hypothetical protein